MKINHKNRGRGKISRPENIHQDSGDVTAGMLISEITQQTFSQSAGQTGNDEKKGEKIPINRVKSRLSNFQFVRDDNNDKNHRP